MTASAQPLRITQILLDAIVENPAGGYDLDENQLQKYRDLADIELRSPRGPRVFFEFMGVVALVQGNASDLVLTQRLMNVMNELVKPEHIRAVQALLAEKSDEKLEAVQGSFAQYRGDSDSGTAVPEPREKIPYSIPKGFIRD